MKILDKAFILTLLAADAVAILVGMVSGPFGYDSLSMGASFSAILISLVIIIYALMSWKRKPR